VRRHKDQSAEQAPTGGLDGGTAAMTRKYFGTDGIRGSANSFPMTSEVALKVGMAAGKLFSNGQYRHRVVIGKDTRLSGYMIESALVSGFTAVGMDVFQLGPMPTPAVAMLTRSLRADLGVMISASHNPFVDNGIKLFGPDGYKLSDEKEEEIEELMGGDAAELLAAPEKIGRATRIDSARERYIEFAKRTLPKNIRFDGIRVVIDCANGAAYKVAPEALWELGAEVIKIGVEPNGLNINQDVGSTSPDALAQKVREMRADVGVALDGDADRAILVDEQGSIVDGDEILAMLAADLHARGDLKRETLVATVMSNLGLHVAMRERGIRLATTPVGDRYVVDEMTRGGFNLGGEQSGHVVFLDHNTTGDGMLTALQVLALMRREERPLSELAGVMQRTPQVLKSVRVRAKPPFDEIAGLAHLTRGARVERYRLNLRYSGTEPLARVMIEGDDPAEIDVYANEICEVIRKAIGEGAK